MPIDISIIIPCFNRIELLKQTLQSVKAAIKTLTAEVILVDDGSDLPIAQQIPEFADLPLVIIRQENSGLTISRYNGMLAAKGKYIQFLDSDDVIAPDKFIVQLSRMEKENADVSHTDIGEYHFDRITKQLAMGRVLSIPHNDKSALFYIKTQPVPHSPIFRRDYLVPIISKPFIPLSRDYDFIGEVWFYYNLAIYPAKIIKVDQPLTFVVNHDEVRLTNNWELMGLCALNLQRGFIVYLPAHMVIADAVKKEVAVAAFSTFRHLPYQMNRKFKYAFIDVWKKLGRTTIKELNGGKYFSALARLIGPVNAALFFQRFNGKDYRKMRSVNEKELSERLQKVLKNH